MTIDPNCTKQVVCIFVANPVHFIHLNNCLSAFCLKVTYVLLES